MRLPVRDASIVALAILILASLYVGTDSSGLRRRIEPSRVEAAAIEWCRAHGGIGASWAELRTSPTGFTVGNLRFECEDGLRGRSTLPDDYVGGYMGPETCTGAFCDMAREACAPFELAVAYTPVLLRCQDGLKVVAGWSFFGESKPAGNPW